MVLREFLVNLQLFQRPLSVRAREDGGALLHLNISDAPVRILVVWCYEF